ncbi:MAG: ABC transporter permease subunit [Promethearchaeota archaeon]
MGISNPSQAQYDAMAHQLGYDLPTFMQFYKFLGDLLTGNWGISITINHGEPVINLIRESFPSMIEFIILPVGIGIVIGILLGKISNRYRGRWVDKLIRLITILGISFPVFFLGLFFQYGLHITDSPLPIIGWKSPMNPTPPTVTGFRMYDAILAGQMYLVGDIIVHYLIPGTILFITTFALITRETRAKYDSKPHQRSVISNSVITGSVFGLVFMSFFLIDITFNLNSFGYMIINAIIYHEYWLLRVCLFAIVITLVIILFISNAIFMLYRFAIKDRIGDRFKKKSGENVNIANNSEEILGPYIKSRLKSPMCIIGLILVLFFVVSVLFSQLITGYTFEQAKALDMGAWNPPSPAHPLGQTEFGRDVFARTMYGLRDSIVFGFGAVLIGLIGGVIFGILAGRFTKWGYKTIMGMMILVYILPAFLIIIFLISSFGFNFLIIYLINVVVVGILLIPNITRAIAINMDGTINIHKIVKPVIIQIPLNVAIAILIYNSVGFLGFVPFSFIQLGSDMSLARVLLFEAPWASLWPGVAIFELVISFLILHVGLKGFGRKVRKRKALKTTASIERQK